MKWLEISRLMDTYQDNEFFPEDGSIADPEAVKRRVRANIRIPAKKKWLTKKKMVLLAAAVAAVLAVIAGAGYPTITYPLISGTLTFEQTPDTKGIIYEGTTAPMELEDGRIFFLRDGERIDITDLISVDTPYIYDGSDPGRDFVYYLIMGGTPEEFGWLEWIDVPYPFTDDGEATMANEDRRMREYHLYCDMYNAQGERVNGYAKGGSFADALNWQNVKDIPWVIAAAEELHLPFIDLNSETGEFFYAPF